MPSHESSVSPASRAAVSDDSTSAAARKPPRTLRSRLPRRRTVLVAAAILLAVVGVLAGRTYWIVRYRIHGDLDSKAMAEFRRWRYEKIALHPEAFDARPFAPETVQAARAFRAEWDAVAEEAKKKFPKDMAGPMGEPSVAGEPSVTSEQTSETLALASFRSLLMSFHALVLKADYEIAIAMTGGEPAAPELGGDPFLDAILVCARMTRARCVEHVRAGREKESLLCWLRLAKAARAHPFDPLIARLVAVEIRNLATDSLVAILDGKPDAARLRELLEFQRGLLLPASLVHPTGFWDEMAIGGLRDARRFGLPVDTGARSRLDRMVDWLHARMEYREKFVVPSMSNGQARADLVEEIRLDREREWFLRGEWRFRPGGITSPEVAVSILYHVATPDYIEARRRELLERTRADLALIAIASALHEAERGAPPAGPEDLVPAYLETWPVDRFTVTPERREGEGLRFLPVPHSVGPDGVDDEAIRAYVPSSGAKGKGDVLLRLPDQAAHGGRM